MTHISENLLNLWQKAPRDNEKTYLHWLRINLEQPIFQHLIDTYLTRLKKWWANYKLPLTSKTNKTIVIYETRILPQLEFHILNTCYFAQGWSLLIYCSAANIGTIRDILGHNKFCAIIHQVESTNNDRITYNEFYKSRQFWDTIPGEYALCVEMDSYLRRRLPHDIIEKHDYICSAWPWHVDQPGGGGLSVKRVAAMKRICDELPDFAKMYPDLDGWASHGIKKLGLTYNNSLFTEAARLADPYGVHQFWTFYSPDFDYSKYLELEITLPQVQGLGPALPPRCN
jgi:hypothetical protein